LKLNMRYLKILLPLLTSLLAFPVFAADVQMRIEPALMSLLDRAVLKIEFIDTKGDAVTIPEIEGLKIQYQGQRSETRIVNFKRTSKVTHNYIVTPTKVGDYTIGPVTCKYQGGQKDVSTQLRIIKPEDDQEAQQISEMLFSRISTDRKTPFVHEPFELEVVIYVRDGIQIDGNFSIRGGIPESGMDGDLKWEVTGRDQVKRDGTIFNAWTLRTTAETLTAGTFTFCPEVQIKVVVPKQNRRPYGFDDPFFGDFFGRQETRAIVLDCNTLEVEVQPVPIQGRPAHFTGGVGRFDFDVEVGPLQVKAGEPVTVKMRIFGEGNISKVIPPTLSASNDLKLYDVRSIPSNNPKEVRFEQVIIPKSGSVTEIPAITFSYFNTQTADFRTLTKGPFPVNVEAVENQAAQVIASPSTVMPITEVLGRDIIYLKPVPAAWTHSTTTAWYQTRLFYIALASPLALLFILALITANRNALANDVARARRQKAPKGARKNVQRAEHAMRKNDEAAFYEAMWKVLTDYFGHRLNLAPGEISLSVVLERLPQEKEALETLFNTIEQRRYGFHGGALSKSEMKILLRQLTATLKKCERIKL
jgi:hypothetical protein